MAPWRGRLVIQHRVPWAARGRATEVVLRAHAIPLAAPFGARQAEPRAPWTSMEPNSIGAPSYQVQEPLPVRLHGPQHS